MSDSSERSRFSHFLAEMRRRHVGRFAFGYAASAFVILQLAEIVFPAFGIGENGLRIVVAAATLGFPPALILAWMYDLTREGITRTESDPTGPWLRTLALGSLLVVTVLATGGAGLYLARQGVFTTSSTPSSSRAPVQAVSFDRSEPIRSIAVLPLVDNSPGGDEAYFAASMHEELIAKLSRIDGLRVVSRTSTMQYADSLPPMPEIARALGVDVLVEGSVVRTPQRTRVTLQLVHGPSDTHIRTLQWDREELEDFLAFQSEVAHEVAEEVRAQHDEEVFRTAASDVDPSAQEAYFRGRFEYDRGTEEGYRMAMAYFGDALEEEPEFAQALAGMAGARFLGALESADVSEDDLMRAYDEAETALALDSTSAETREVFALIERSLPTLMDEPPPPTSPSGGLRSVRILRLPGEGDSITIDVAALDTAWVAPMTSLGERIEARVRRQTEAIGGGAADRLASDARRLISMGRYAEAEAVLDGALALTPSSTLAWDLLVRSHVARGDLTGALEAARRWTETFAAAADGGGGPGRVASDHASPQALEAALEDAGAAGYWAWRLARLEAAERTGADVPSFELASTHAALGNDERALQYLVRALRAGEPGVMSIRTDPVWDDLRTDPRLREILREAQRIRFAPDGRIRTPGGRGR